jgi:uroporphyrinogen-III decarboxylase
MSPQHWRQFVFPHMKDFCDEVHRYADDARIYCHICGNVLPIVEDLVETGLDCIGPLDPLGGFTPADVRSRIGDAVSLMGGVDTLSFVNRTPEEIVEESRRCIEGAGAAGGFVLGSGCVVPRSAKRENLAALRTAADRYGTYQAAKLPHPAEHEGG